jgi:hypothetical protein
MFRAITGGVQNLTTLDNRLAQSVQPKYMAEAERRQPNTGVFVHPRRRILRSNSHPASARATRRDGATHEILDVLVQRRQPTSSAGGHGFVQFNRRTFGDRDGRDLTERVDDLTGAPGWRDQLTGEIGIGALGRDVRGERVNRSGAPSNVPVTATRTFVTAASRARIAARKWLVKQPLRDTSMYSPPPVPDPGRPSRPLGPREGYASVRSSWTLCG